RRDERVPRLQADIARVTFECLSKVVRTPVVPRDAEDGEFRGKLAHLVELGQSRHQLAGSQVAAGAKDDEAVAHAGYLDVRLSRRLKVSLLGAVHHRSAAVICWEQGACKPVAPLTSAPCCG